MTLRTQIAWIIKNYIHRPSVVETLLDEIMPLVEGKQGTLIGGGCCEKCSDLTRPVKMPYLNPDCLCHQPENKCCGNCVVYVNGYPQNPSICGDTNCACHRLTNGATGHQKEAKGGHVIGSPQAITTASAHPLGEGWEKELEKFYPLLWQEEKYGRINLAVSIDRLLSFFSQTLAQERSKWVLERDIHLKEIMRDIIENATRIARQEERAKVLKEVREKAEKVWEETPHKSWEDTAYLFKNNLLSLLTDLQVNKERG